MLGALWTAAKEPLRDATSAISVSDRWSFVMGWYVMTEGSSLSYTQGVVSCPKAMGAHINTFVMEYRIACWVIVYTPCVFF